MRLLLVDGNVVNKMSVARTFTIVLGLLATSMPTCAQKQAKYVVPAITNKELLSTPSIRTRTGKQPSQDGITLVTYAQLFKEGEAHYSPIYEQRLRQLPPLPTGFSLFKGLAFHLETTAVASGSNTVVFNVPSADSQSEFSKLRILHLEYDELSPTSSSWLDRTVVSGRWHQELFPLIPKEDYSRLTPDFSRRMLVSVVNDFGIFAVASVEQPEAPIANQPFTDIGIDVQVSPQPVRAGEGVTYTFTVSNRGAKGAGYVGFIHKLDTYMDFISVASAHGDCKESNQSTGRVLCLFNGLAADEIASITVKAKIRRSSLWEGQAWDSVDTTTVVFKERATDLRHYFVRKQVKTSIVP